MQVFVLGMHRSGTSAFARVLNLMGLYFGGEEVGIGRSAENEKGFWERRDVRALNDAMLFEAGCDWDCLSSLNIDALPTQQRARYVALAGDIVLKLDAHRPWFVKEPRLCALFPIWRAASETPICVHVFRNPLEVASSLRERNGVPLQVGLALWEAYNIRALAGAAGLPRLCASFEGLLQRPVATAGTIHAALQELGDYPLRLPTEPELTRFLDRRMHRRRHSEDELRSVANVGQLAVYDLLRGRRVAGCPRRRAHPLRRKPPRARRLRSDGGFGLAQGECRRRRGAPLGRGPCVAGCAQGPRSVPRQRPHQGSAGKEPGFRAQDGATAGRRGRLPSQARASERDGARPRAAARRAGGPRRENARRPCAEPPRLPRHDTPEPSPPCAAWTSNNRLRRAEDRRIEPARRLAGGNTSAPCWPRRVGVSAMRWCPGRHCRQGGATPCTRCSTAPTRHSSRDATPSVRWRTD